MLGSYEIKDAKIYVKNIYCEALNKKYRSWGGKFDRESKSWILPIGRLDKIKELFGSMDAPQIEILVKKGDWESDEGCYFVGGYVLASRRSRDAQVETYADMVSGTLPPYGGSTKYPLIKASDDAQFTLWVPQDFAITRKLHVINATNTQQDALKQLYAEKECLLKRLYGNNLRRELLDEINELILKFNP